MNRTKIERIKGSLPSLLSLATAVGLSLESYLALQGKSLCRTQACEVVGTYLRIDESLLVLGGVLFFWALFITLFFSSRYPKYLKFFPTLLLLPAVAFDGAIIGYQIFTIQQKCYLCLAVATSLILIATLYFFLQDKHILFMSILFIWISSFLANSLIEMPEPTLARSQMIFFQQDFSKRNTSENVPEFTFIFSMNCPHCHEVISYLSDNKPKVSKWKFAITDQDNESLRKLSAFIDESKASDNPFRLLKNAIPIVQGSSISDLKYKSKKTITFLANMEFNSIPLLIVKESETEEKLLLGSPAILEYLKSQTI